MHYISGAYAVSRVSSFRKHQFPSLLHPTPRTCFYYLNKTLAWKHFKIQEIVSVTVLKALKPVHYRDYSVFSAKLLNVCSGGPYGPPAGSIPARPRASHIKSQATLLESLHKQVQCTLCAVPAVQYINNTLNRLNGTYFPLPRATCTTHTTSFG